MRKEFPFSINLGGSPLVMYVGTLDASFTYALCIVAAERGVVALRPFTCAFSFATVRFACGMLALVWFALGGPLRDKSTVPMPFEYLGSSPSCYSDLDFHSLEASAS